MTTIPKSASSANLAYNHIRTHILNGTYREGERITEQQVSDLLGLSRTPVREAMRRLVSDGFLHFQPNSGTFVRTWDAAEVEAIYDARILLEPELAAHAARHMTAPVLARMHQIQDEIESRGADIAEDNLVRISPLNRDFHALISDTAQNPRLAHMRVQSLEIQIIQRTRRRLSAHQLDRIFHHHRELLDAFACRDSDWARCVMSCHLRTAKLAMLGPGPNVVKL
ncbi:GntR family transcriptional regulator [uncultured Xylophilus sp.]|uniref:GntR family transcriptional regulator n=1 Tax=uncultured Xylophilus sp. TaxID=296832 RepID=UPI0025FEFDD8|nr:GntR family transcriptional regulator [uncultured Xylophilus sp.]